MAPLVDFPIDEKTIEYLDFGPKKTPLNCRSFLKLRDFGLIRGS
jgi:hypothetical protein